MACAMKNNTYIAIYVSQLCTLYQLDGSLSVTVLLGLYTVTGTKVMFPVSGKVQYRARFHICTVIGGD